MPRAGGEGETSREFGCVGTSTGLLKFEMADHETVCAALPQLKVFPLPQGVLLPGSGMPLHVHEPRYRTLVREALRGDRVLAVAMLAPGWEAGYGGRPPLRSIAGAGVIEEAHRDSDGSYDILVRGVMRVQIESEHATVKPFREVVALVPEELPMTDAHQIETVRRAVLQLSESLPEDLAQGVSVAAARITDPATLCDVIAAALFEDAEVLQSILEAVDVQARIRRVLGEIGSLLLAAHPPPPDGLLS